MIIAPCRAVTGRSRANDGGFYESCERRTWLRNGLRNTHGCTAFDYGRNGAGHRPPCFVRSQGQPAVDAAALAAASAIPSGNWSTVTDRAAKFNPGGTNPGIGNNYVSSPINAIAQKNLTLVKYDNASGEFTTTGVNINNASGVRVALENSNPYGGNAGKAMQTPLFLTPLFNLFGQKVKTTADVSVSAVAVNQALPGLPIVVVQTQFNQAG